MTDDQEQMIDTVIEPQTSPLTWLEFRFPIMGGKEQIVMWLPSALDQRDQARLKALIDSWPQC